MGHTEGGPLEADAGRGEKWDWYPNRAVSKEVCIHICEGGINYELHTFVFLIIRDKTFLRDSWPPTSCQ